MHDVYILLTRSTTYFSRLIKLVTSDKYTHASIGFDGLDGEFYSFGRKHCHTLLPAGFVRERIQAEQMYSGMTYYTLYKLRLNAEDFNKVVNYIKSIATNDEIYSYNIIGVLATFFGLTIKRRHHFYCSQFVAHALINSTTGRYIRDTNKIKPADFTKLPDIEIVSYGYIGGLARSKQTKSNYNATITGR